MNPPAKGICEFCARASLDHGNCNEALWRTIHSQVVMCPSTHARTPLASMCRVDLRRSNALPFSLQVTQGAAVTQRDSEAEDCKPLAVNVV